MSQHVRPPHDITPTEFFTRWLGASVASDPERRRKLADTRAVMVFELTGVGGGEFTVYVDGGTVRGEVGRPHEPDLEIEVDVETWRRLNAGELSAPEAALRRRVKLQGDLLLAIKLHLILG